MGRQIVTSLDEAIENVRRFARELEREPGLATRLGQARAWYALRTDRGWAFAPSKFAGYAQNTAREYLATARDQADGRETEDALERWSEAVGPESRIGRELFGALRDFLASWNRKPNKRARISIVDPPEIQAPAVRLESALMERIATDPQICGGRPTIAGTRMRVSDVVELLASGVDRPTILKDFPYLAEDDISAALLYAARATSHRVIRAA